MNRRNLIQSVLGMFGLGATAAVANPDKTKVLVGVGEAPSMHPHLTVVQPVAAVWWPKDNWSNVDLNQYDAFALFDFSDHRRRRMSCAFLGSQGVWVVSSKSGPLGRNHFDAAYQDDVQGDRYCRVLDDAPFARDEHRLVASKGADVYLATGDYRGFPISEVLVCQRGEDIVNVDPYFGDIYHGHVKFTKVK